MKNATWLLLGVLAVLIIALPARAEDTLAPWFLRAELGLSLVDDSRATGMAAITGSYSVSFGYARSRLGLFAAAEHSLWHAAEVANRVVPGVCNIALGFELRSFGDRLRSSLAIGTSTLLFDAVVADVGTTGLFAEVRPTVIRWRFAGGVLELSPLSLAIMAPVLRNDPHIERVLFRTVLTLEVWP